MVVLRASLLLLVLTAWLGPAAFSQVSVSDSTTTWLTYGHSIAENGTLADYSLDASSLVEHEFETIVLENEFLRITLLPEYGGRIISLVYKPTGHEQLYQNPVGSPYGWWWTGTFYYNWLMIYGGIFPTVPEPEHGKSWFAPWDAELVTQSTDTVRVKMTWKDDVEFSQYSRYGRTNMEVDFIVTLVAGRASLGLEVVLKNNAPVTQRFEYWTNASMAPGSEGDMYAAAATGGAEIIIPAPKLKIPSWAVGITGIEQPVPGEPNTYDFDKLRRWSNWDGSGSAFTRPALQENYWGVINHDNEEGLIRVSDNVETPYVKIWTFGYPTSTGIDPFNPPPAQDNASDLYYARPFIELWAGVSPEFNVPSTIGPNGTRSWTETYVPTVGLRGVTDASEEAVAHFEVEKESGTVMLNFMATRPGESLDVTVGSSGSAPSFTIIDTTIVADAELSVHLRGQIPVESLTPGDRLEFNIQSGEGEVYLQGSTIVPTTTSLSDNSETIPGSPLLVGNYPNPFTGQTTIRFNLNDPGPVAVSVFNVLGEHVETLIDGPLAAGSHEAVFDATSLPAGMYLLRVQSDSMVATRKMLLLN